MGLSHAQSGSVCCVFVDRTLCSSVFLCLISQDSLQENKINILIEFPVNPG